MKNATLSAAEWVCDPRRAIVEAAKRGFAVIRTGAFLDPVTGDLSAQRHLSFTPTLVPYASDVIGQRKEQMVLFLESILPCLDAIVEEEYDVCAIQDDTHEFRKIFEDEVMWKVVDAELGTSGDVHSADQYQCGVCGLELTNSYKQCLGCTVFARHCRPNVKYDVVRLCLRCHAQPEHHHYRPPKTRGYYDKMVSSEGHTGLLPASRRYQSVRSYFKCRCAPYIHCAYCGGCESCSCLCHTMFQTRFRFESPGLSCLL